MAPTMQSAWLTITFVLRVYGAGGIYREVINEENDEVARAIRELPHVDPHKQDSAL